MTKTYNYSQLISHNRCRFMWQVGYQRHIESRMPHLKIDLGSAVHAGLSAYWTEYPRDKTDNHTQSHVMGLLAIEEWADEILPGWREIILNYEDEINALDQVIAAFDDNPDQFSVEEAMTLSIAPIVERAKEVFTRTVRYIGDSWEVLMHEGTPIVEREFVYKNVLVHVDLAVRDRATGIKMIVDFKVRQNVQDPEGVEYDLQTALYQIVLQGNGIDIGATALMQTRAVTPRKPKLNKDGKSMSRSDIITDWPTYHNALLEAGLDPADYGDMMMKLSAKRFFQLDMAYRGKERLKAIWEKVVQPAIHEVRLSERRYKGGTIPAPRSMSTFNCSGCLVRHLCMAELEGMDTSQLMQSMYEYKGENNGK